MQLLRKLEYEQQLIKLARQKLRVTYAFWYTNILAWRNVYLLVFLWFNFENRFHVLSCTTRNVNFLYPYPISYGQVGKFNWNSGCLACFCVVIADAKCFLSLDSTWITLFFNAETYANIPGTIEYYFSCLVFLSDLFLMGAKDEEEVQRNRIEIERKEGRKVVFIQSFSGIPAFFVREN